MILYTSTEGPLARGDRVRFLRHKKIRGKLATVVEVLLDRSSSRASFWYRVRVDDRLFASLDHNLYTPDWLEAVGPLEELAACALE